MSILKTNMVQKARLELRLRKIDETRTYLSDEIKQNALISEKYEKTCKYINYVEHFLTLASTVPSCVSFFAFASVVAIPVDITNFAVGIKVSVITSGMKSINQKRKNKKYNKTMLL